MSEQVVTPLMLVLILGFTGLMVMFWFVMRSLENLVKEIQSERKMLNERLRHLEEAQSGAIPAAAVVPVAAVATATETPAPHAASEPSASEIPGEPEPVLTGFFEEAPHTPEDQPFNEDARRSHNEPADHHDEDELIFHDEQGRKLEQPQSSAQSTKKTAGQDEPLNITEFIVTE